ncbi:hypothetical protein U9M48_028781 [Paspalum notatum var. saurae]|uniref:Peptidase A1 domain-containing protein n=1 Tax=Paspalum notatum var. saurae TaxID=547442 RepID=A0AAQ3X1R7_PASNO
MASLGMPLPNRVLPDLRVPRRPHHTLPDLRTRSPISARFPSPAVIPEADPARHPQPAFRPATQPDRKLTQITLFNADRLPPPPPSSTRITSPCRIAFTRRPASSTANIDIEKAAAYKRWLMRAARIRIGGSASSVHNDDNVVLQCASCVRCRRHLCWRQTRVDGVVCSSATGWCRAAAAALKRCSDPEIARMLNDRKQSMIEQMRKVVNELDSIHFSIKKASQLVKEIGVRSGNKLPLVHRMSPCSLFGSGAPRQANKQPSLQETLHRDGLRLSYLSGIHQTAAAAPAPAPAASAMPSSGQVLVLATPNVVSSFPGLYDYTIIAGYGTPAQQLPFYLDIVGTSSLWCKPCFRGTSGAVPPCDLAFDPSRSSSFRTVPCGSPDCTTESCSTGPCTYTNRNSTFVFINGTVVTDTLTLSSSTSTATFENFLVTCINLDNLYSGGDDVAMGLGTIALGPSSHSLANRALLSSPPGTAAFSYCLPEDTDTHGFLTIAPTLSEYSSIAGVKYIPLLSNPAWPYFYFVDLVAVTINGKDLPLPPAEFGGNGTVIDVQSAFTYLNPSIYTALRDEFKKAMAQYQPAPAFSDLDTCYNFTGVQTIYLPDITLKFGNGETMDLDDRQFMYFFRDHLDDSFPFGCLAFAAADGLPWNLLGSQVQRTKEIVYDLRGGKVAFVPSRCGLR